ncbi:sensor histidine kinase [Winogradskyella sp.]|uniref:sensor histidine kinase n=1 Tax=Winogradskyella sp. TaxID=1883156 RepID=UPI00260D1AFF|nr:histidine kinase [Winogradskyella sp.]
MKYKLTYVLKWYFLFFFLVDALRETIGSTVTWDVIVSLLKNPIFYMVFVSTFSLFSLYVLAAYTVLFKFYKRKPLGIILLLIIILWMPTIAGRYFFEEVILTHYTGVSNYGENVTYANYLKDNLYMATLHSVLGAVLYFIQLSKYNTERALEMREEKQKMELAFLRSQSSPHFLFNMLNNIYSLVFVKSEKALIAIDRLSQLLRYSLYENKTDSQLNNEFEQLQNYIELESLRYDEDYSVTLTTDIKMPKARVPQFLFIPFVENAIKHGLVTDKNNPITIRIIAKDGKLNYSVENTYIDKVKDNVGGIGLKNLEKRLDIVFDGNMYFNTSKSDNKFLAELEIPIK